MVRGLKEWGWGRGEAGGHSQPGHERLLSLCKGSGFILKEMKGVLYREGT